MPWLDLSHYSPTGLKKSYPRGFGSLKKLSTAISSYLSKLQMDKALQHPKTYLLILLCTLYPWENKNSICKTSHPKCQPSNLTCRALGYHRFTTWSAGYFQSRVRETISLRSSHQHALRSGACSFLILCQLLSIHLAFWNHRQKRASGRRFPFLGHSNPNHPSTKVKGHVQRLMFLVRLPLYMWRFETKFVTHSTLPMPLL